MKGIGGPGPVQVKKLPSRIQGRFPPDRGRETVAHRRLPFKVTRTKEGDSWQTHKLVFCATPTLTSPRAALYPTPQAPSVPFIMGAVGPAHPLPIMSRLGRAGAQGRTYSWPLLHTHC